MVLSGMISRGIWHDFDSDEAYDKDFGQPRSFVLGVADLDYYGKCKSELFS
jgi:hypothetical protein